MYCSFKNFERTKRYFFVAKGYMDYVLPITKSDRSLGVTVTSQKGLVSSEN